MTGQAESQLKAGDHMSLSDRDYMQKRRKKRGSNGTGRIGSILSWLMWIALGSAAYFWWFR
jgi:hypothetical protein